MKLKSIIAEIKILLEGLSSRIEQAEKNWEIFT